MPQMSQVLREQFLHKLSENCLREAHLHACHPHLGLDLSAVNRRNRFEWANAHIQWRLALWRGVLFTDESRFSLYSADDRQHVWRRVGERFADVNIVGSSGPWWRWGYGMGRRMLWTTNTGACTEIQWRDPEGPLLCHSSTTITSCLQHDNARPHVVKICTPIPGSWKTSQFNALASILTGHVTHWGMFAMLWIGVYDSVFQSSCQYPATSHSHWRGVDQHFHRS